MIRSSRWLDRVLVGGVLLLLVAITTIVVLQAGRERARNNGSPTAAAIVPTTAALPPPLATPLASSVATPLAGNVVCLDLGHGGMDWGNVRLEDEQVVLREKDLTLTTGLDLARRLRSDGLTVVTTRDTDTEANPANADVNGDGIVASPDDQANSDELDDQQARVNICNEAGADLLVSIHYNAAENTALEGFEVWYNDQRPFSDQSERLATLVHEELATRLTAAGLDATDRGIGIEDHAVTGPERPHELAPSEMPGVVVEGLFLSNDDDAAFIQTPGGEEAIVTAYERAIRAYFGASAG